MPTVRFIGDVHGKFARYKAIIKNSPPSIQVGDMGVGFTRWPHGESSENPPYDAMESNHRFIRGNHDNPNVCRHHSQWIADGTIEGDMMLIGGALSIDRHLRHVGYSWWEDEELSTSHLNELVDKYREVKPRIMVTHECPDAIALRLVHKMQIPGAKLEPEFASRTRQAFESMWDLHQPQIWLFGHWHFPFDEVINGTRFICLAELAHLDLEV